MRALTAAARERSISASPTEGTRSVAMHRPGWCCTKVLHACAAVVTACWRDAPAVAIASDCTSCSRVRSPRSTLVKYFLKITGSSLGDCKAEKSLEPFHVNGDTWGIFHLNEWAYKSWLATIRSTSTQQLLQLKLRPALL